MRNRTRTLPRLQFTIRQLLAIVGLAAVLSFLFAEFSLPVVLSILLVTSGFLLDRRRGHAGILGSMLAGMLGFAAYGLAIYAYNTNQGQPPPFRGPGDCVTFFGSMGLCLGTIFGLGAWWAVTVLGLLKKAWSSLLESLPSAGPRPPTPA